MNHLLILPLLIPFAAGVGLLLARRLPVAAQRWVGALSTAVLILVAIRLLGMAAQGEITVYLVGDWPAPFGIVLVLDRLAALMLLTTALLAGAALAYAIGGSDRIGQGFHALFQFQLLGLNGAFLTGDLFNLFVFFEILLIASYSLLLHGGGPARTRAALHYVVLNLVGSSLFLIGVALIYAATGTLNLADLARVLPGLGTDARPIAAAGGMLLVAVFGLKAAALPLHFWLPHAYGAASAPVAALFAIMTKVGIYAMVRVFAMVFGSSEGPLAELFAPWLLGAALLTLAGGTFGAVASADLREMIAYLVIASVGTLLAGLALGSGEALAGTLYYLVHSTLVAGGLFLVADLIAHGRGQGAALVVGDRPPRTGPLAVLFLIGGIAVVGMPPLSGLVGKVMILMAAQTSPWVAWIWTAVLVSSLFVLIGLSRAGITLLWCGEPRADGTPAALRLIAPAALLLAMSPLMVAFGGWLTAYTGATATQVIDASAYIEAVLNQAPASALRPLGPP